MLQAMAVLAWASVLPAPLVDTQPSAETAPARLASSRATEVVCRRLPPPAGTRLGARNVCKTQRDWDAMREEARREIQRHQDQGGVSP